MAGEKPEVTTPLLGNIENQAQALEQIANHQFGAGRAALLRAAALLAGKKRIVVSGMGASLFASIPFGYALAAAGRQVTTIESGELLYFPSTVIDSDTAVVLVSRSGESVEVTKLLPKLKERGAAVVGVVNVEGTTLALEADVAIVVGSPADQLVAIQTYTGTVAMFALLAAAIEQQVDAARAELARTVTVMSGWVPACVEASLQWKEFLRDAAPLYVLGRGPGLATVAEGVLLSHETAKAPTVGMSVPQFRHGPVEVADERLRAVIIGTQPSTVDLDALLAADLARMGGKVRWIGPSDGLSVEPLCAWPANVPARFSPIVEIVPLQLAAYRKAELNGVRPGDFRWAPLVTKTEAGFFSPDAP